jgi:hypothetical protein
MSSRSRGGLGQWCPDCGATLRVGAPYCDACGLSFSAQVAFDLAHANGAIHHIREERERARRAIELMDQREEEWLERRDVLRLSAPRVHAAQAAPPPPPVPGTAASAAPPAPDHVAGVAVPGASVPEVTVPAASAPGASAPAASVPEVTVPAASVAEPWAAPTATAQEVHAQEVPALHAPAPGPAHKPARRLSAAALLGVSGASLVILAAIVFVAASWDSFVPVVRAGFLILFAGFFAWLGLRATRHEFPTIGGSLGVVAVGFVGVAQIAWRMDESGVKPYTLALVFFAVAAAGVALDRTRLRAVGATAAVAVPLAVLSLGIEFAGHADSEEVAASRFVIITSLAGLAFLWLKRLWSTPLHRGIVTWSGASAAILAAIPVIGLPYAIDDAGALAGVAMVTGIAALTGLALWRPIVGAGPLTGVVVITSVTLVNQVIDWGWGTDLVLAVLIVLAVGLLSFGNRQWRIAGLAGLGLPLLWLAVMCTLTGAAPIPGALFGEDSISGTGYVVANLGVADSLAYAGVILVLASAAGLMRTWRLPAGPEKVRVATGVWLSAAALIVAGFSAYDIGEATHWLNAPGIVAAGIAVWFVWRVWGASQRRTMEVTAVVVAALVAVTGPLRAANLDSGLSRADSAAWVISVAIAATGLAYASRRVAPAAFIASLSSTMLVGALVWRASASVGLTVVAAAAVASGIVGVVKPAASRATNPTSITAPTAITAPISFALLGALPAVVLGALFAAYGAVIGTVWTVAPAGDWELSVTWAEPSAAVIVVLAGLLFARAFRGRVEEALSHAFVTIGLILLIPHTSGFVATAVPEAEHPWLPVVVLLVTLAVWPATVMKPLRASRVPVAIAGVAATSLVTLTWLGRMAVDGAEWRIIVSLAVVALAGIALAFRWPAYTLAPAIATASLIAPAALAQVDPWAAGISAAAGTAILTWSGRLAARRGAAAHGRWIAGTVLAGVITAAAAVTSLGLTGVAWAESRPSGDVAWRGWALAAIVLGVVASLAWPRVRRQSAAILIGTAVVAAGLVPAPVGWVVLALIAVFAAEAGARWAGRAGLHRLHGVWAIIAAAVWMPWRPGPAAIVEAFSVVVFVWTAVRSRQHTGTRAACAIAAPLAAVLAAVHALVFLGAGYGPSALGGAVIGFTVAIALLAGKVLGSEGTAWVLGAVTVVMPVATMDLLAGGLLVLVASAAWYALFAFSGVPRARVTAFWLLSPAAALLLAAVGATALEAYVAVPGATVLGLGLLRMRRDATIRTYAALAPGLGLILIPSYIAMVLDPQVLIRPLALAFSAAVLGLIGVGRQWFAPLLATAVTAVVLATSQVMVEDALVPRWVSFGFIGAVLLVLGFTAERIRTMR